MGIESQDHKGSRAAAISAIFVFFIVALEIVIMISPFAFFFYSVFNPFLLTLNQSPATRWLTAFFLPHMVAPPNEVLTVVRVLGSVLFVGGILLFLVCAGQVYLGKLLKKRVAIKGLYSFVRHPQYISLGLAGLGLAIMWPRFLTLVLLAVMLFLYYLLAKDEERRMMTRFGESYLAYMRRTGMFFPPLKKGAREKPGRLTLSKAFAIFLILVVMLIGGGFISRIYTVRHLPLEEMNHVDVLAITEDDLMAARQLVPGVLQDSTIASRMQPLENVKGHRLLAYFIPVDYVMQGMIADTGPEWKLFEHHKTLSMIADYILHPFGHLTGGHSHEMMGPHHPTPSLHSNPAMRRRIILVEVFGTHLASRYDDFDINNRRTPLFFVDVHLHTGEILQVKNTPSGSGWGSVPTPTF